jgi:hypothetical protein
MQFTNIADMKGISQTLFNLDSKFYSLILRQHPGYLVSLDVHNDLRLQMGLNGKLALDVF